MIYPSIGFKITTLLPKEKEGDNEERLGNYSGTVYDSMNYLESIGINFSLSKMYSLKKGSKVWFVPKDGFKNLLIFYKKDQVLAQRLHDEGYDFHVEIERIKK